MSAVRVDVDVNVLISLEEVLRISPWEDTSDGGIKLTAYAQKILRARRLLGFEPVIKVANEK